MPGESLGYLAAFAGIIGGVIGWIFRSSLDIFYIRFRDRKNTEKAIKRDLASIKSTYILLRQEEFLNALRKSDLETAKSLSEIATVRAKEVKADYTSVYGPAFFLLADDKMKMALEAYRKIYASRIIFSKISALSDNEQWEKAATLALKSEDLFESTSRAVDAALHAF